MKYPLKILLNTNINQILLNDEDFTDLLIDHYEGKVYSSEYDEETDQLIPYDVSSKIYNGSWYIKMLFSNDTEIDTIKNK